MFPSNWFRKIARRLKTRKAVVGTSLVELEQKFREIAAIHVTGTKNYTFNAEWLGWGKGQRMYLAVYIPHSIPLPAEELRDLGQLISSGLTKLKVLHSVVHEIRSAPPSRDEFNRTLEDLKALLGPKGMSIVVDEDKRTITLSRVPGAESASFTMNDTPEFALKMQAAQCFFRGYKTSYRVLVESEGIHFG